MSMQSSKVNNVVFVQMSLITAHQSMNTAIWLIWPEIVPEQVNSRLCVCAKQVPKGFSKRTRVSNCTF